MARLTSAERHSAVLAAVRAAHRQWTNGKNVSQQTRLSVKINNDWQQRAVAIDEGIIKEVALPGEHKQRIDLVDTVSGVAYELKVSQNNVHMEFYRDIFKVLIFNRLNTKSKRIKALYFLAPHAGLKAMGPMQYEAIKIAKKSGGVLVKCVAVDWQERKET